MRSEKKTAEPRTGICLLLTPPRAVSRGTPTRIAGIIGGRMLVYSPDEYEEGMVVHLATAARTHVTGEIKQAGRVKDGSFYYAIEVHGWNIRPPRPADPRGGRR